MLTTTRSSSGARTGGDKRLPHSRPLHLSLLGLIAAGVLMLTPAVASADDPTTLTVVGTSDVSDSGLIQNVVQPRFHDAYPQYTFKYIGTGTGAAITSAKTGSQGASVLIVHAASLENQFVGDGFSYEQYGRAIWTNDFVFAGPTADPADVGADGANNIAQAFADVAEAGINGGGSPAVTFVSRGGTPGTTVSEHAIWQLVDEANLEPAGLVLCTVGAASGGGETPIAAGQVTNSGDPCPGAGSPPPTGGALPGWYAATGLTQGPNVVSANACTGFNSPAGPPPTCYVYTDRGTYDYLASGSSPAGGAAGLPNLKIVSRGPQAASAPGGEHLLINYFHAYVINPAQVPNVNLPAAQAFVDLLTSPGLQAQLKFYLNTINPATDPGGAPFVAVASPQITATGFPARSAAGSPVTVTGTVTNSQPGFPAPAGAAVTVNEIVGGLPVPVGSGLTDSNGNYSVTFTPGSSGSYQVSTGQIAMVAIPSLNPVFGDLLSPAATTPVSMNVQSAITIGSARAASGGATVSGTVAPGAPDANAGVTILARRQGSGGDFARVGGTSLAAGQGNYAANAALQPGRWEVRARYEDPDQLLPGTSDSANVTVPAATSAATFGKVSVKNGRLTIRGRLNQAPTSGGASIRLFGMRTVKVKRAKSSAAFRRIKSQRLRAGQRTFTMKVKLKRGYRWAIQLQYVKSGSPSVFSKLRTVNVR